MANLWEPEEVEQKAWAVFLKHLPPHLRGVAERFPPWACFRLRTTRQTCLVVAFSDEEPVTVRVDVGGLPALLSSPRSVFGVDPKDLEACEVPAEGVAIGLRPTPKERAEYLEEMRLLAAYGD